MNPRALAAFVAENCGIESDDVMAISVKSAYAFFTVKDELADKIIPGLSDKIVGKKTVKINFANSQKGKGPRAEAPAHSEEEAPAEEAAPVEEAAPAEEAVVPAPAEEEATAPTEEAVPAPAEETEQHDN